MLNLGFLWGQWIRTFVLSANIFNKGPFVFYQGGGGGGNLKKYGFKKEGQAENIGCKGRGGYPKNSFKFCSDGGCDNVNNPFLPECQKPVFLMFRKFKLSWGRKPLDPLLYYAPKGNSTPPKWRVVRGASQLNWDTRRVFISAEIRIQIVNNSCNTCSFTP